MYKDANARLATPYIATTSRYQNGSFFPSILYAPLPPRSANHTEPLINAAVANAPKNAANNAGMVDSAVWRPKITPIDKAAIGIVAKAPKSRR